jgi:predicted kinase
VLHDLAAQEIGTLLTLTLPILYTVDARASTKAVYAYVWEHRKLWSALLTGGAAPILKQEFVRRAQQLAAERPAKGSWLPGDLSVVFSVSATVDVLAWWLAQEQPPPIDKMAEILERLVVAPSLQGVTLHRP